MATDVKRLFEQFQPHEYSLELAIHEDTMTFNGIVTIEGKKTGRPSKRITLHQKDLEITNATIVHTDKTGHTHKEIARINKHESYDEVRLHTNETLYPGQYTLTLAFNGAITTAMNGMYPCHYEEKGQKKQLIATQFESHHAREVFPCIDEPEAKAVFHVSLNTRHTEVVGNAPVKNSKKDGDRLITTFEPTPIMSTYLLAYVVGDMKYKEATSKGGVKIRAYATTENVEFVDFSLETAVRSIDYYEDFFGIPYPLTKCDLLALPDFASGAMENWGCITFREQCMLVDPENTSLPTKQYVAMVVAHELAHMWFGNLVTMQWWTDLWLNEGFATWVEYLACNELFPEWNMWVQFTANEQQAAMKLDSLENTHPIEVPVHHPDEIRTIFDTISYSKGASVIHQLYAYIGENAFKKGLQLYLKKHAFKNTTTLDLWSALSEASGKDIKKFMHNWTSEPGYPLVSVSRKNDTLQLEQKRFYMQPPAHKHTATTWQIPILSDATTETTLHKQSQTIALLGASTPVINKNRSGFYRIAYANDLLSELTTLIDTPTLTELDRLGILADLFESCKSGDSSVTATLDFLSHYKHEQSAVVWGVIAHIIGNIRLVLGNDDLREAIKPYIKNLAATEYRRLGWDKKPEDTHFDQLLRPTILALLASADHKEVVKRCHELFDTITVTEQVDPELRLTVPQGEVKRNIDIDPDTRGVVFGTVARLGNEETFDKLLSLYNETTLSEEKLTYCSALTDFEQPELIERALALIKSDAVRHQDVGYWIAYSFMNKHARARTWRWMKENWAWLEENLGTDLSFYRTPLYAARVHSDDEFTADYIAFFTDKITPSLERSYKQGLEILSWQSAWRKRDEAKVLRYFTDMEQK